MSTYEAEFYWFGPANEVSLTGSFDDWSKSVRMEKTPAGFSAKVKLPYGQKVDYKYVVDGQWHVNEDFPTTYDWQGNINNYIVTPNEPEPVPEAPKALPTPPPELVIKAPSSPANDEPVTPINLPAPVAAVTPMEVPTSAVSPHPDLAVDPVVGRDIVETIVAATKPEETPKEEKAEEIAQAVVVEETKVEAPKPAEPKAEEAKAEEVVPVSVLATEIFASPASIPATPEVEAPQPSTNDVKPEVVVTPAEPVALNSPVKPAAPALPESKPVAESKPAAETSAAPPAPTAVPLPETPAATPAAEKQPEAASHFSTTTDGTKPEAPVTPKKSESGTIKRGSTRVFSFNSRRASNDSASETSTTKSPKSPGTPGSSKGTETGRKKRSSFMTKVHDLFHPHHKEEKGKA